MVTDKETFVLGSRFFSGIYFVVGVVAFFIMTGSHLWAVVNGKVALDVLHVLCNIFWSAVVYSVLMALDKTNYEGKCFYCRKDIYGWQGYFLFSWKEKTVHSGTVVSLEKFAHRACHEKANEEQKFKFPQ